jgi:hypothetical protein
MSYSAADDDDEIVNVKTRVEMAYLRHRITACNCR